MARPRGRTINTEIILTRWRQGCDGGFSTQVIADSLGISKRTLQQAVYRARRDGHPDAVRHPLFVEPGQGFTHLVSGPRARASHRRAVARLNGA